MMRGGLGYLDKNGQLILPLDFLEHLSVTDGGVLFGCYYPRSDSPYSNPDSVIEHDFMLTPVPPRFWSRCARLLVRLKHQPDALRPLAELLAGENVAILHSECSRSGHRYSTWSFHIIFEKPDKPGRYDRRRRLYPAIEKARLDLERKIQLELGDVLFQDVSDADLRRAVRSWPHTSLAYFANNVSEKNPGEDDTFRVHCRADGVLDPDDSRRFYSIVTNLDVAASEPVLPSAVYANLDTRFYTVRLGLLPNQHIARFFEINVVHERTLGPDSCLGLIADILRLLGDQYTVWRTYNFIERHFRTGSEGRIVLLVEDRSRNRSNDPLDYIAQVRDRLPQGQGLGIGRHSRIKHVSFFPVTPRNVRGRLVEQSSVHGVPTYAVFISYHDKDRSLAEQIRNALDKAGLPAFLASSELRTGDQISPGVLDAIRNSQEMCVLCTKDSLRSIWVARECGAAWALDKHIAPIAYGVDLSKIPVGLADMVGVEFSQLEVYVAHVRLRRTDRGWERQSI